MFGFFVQADSKAKNQLYKNPNIALLETFYQLCSSHIGDRALLLAVGGTFSLLPCIRHWLQRSPNVRNSFLSLTFTMWGIRSVVRFCQFLPQLVEYLNFRGEDYLLQHGIAFNKNLQLTECPTLYVSCNLCDYHMPLFGGLSHKAWWEWVYILHINFAEERTTPAASSTTATSISATMPITFKLSQTRPGV